MDLPGTQSDGVEARYAHLLKPIKDLAQNWNIDISSALENYLEELDHTTISFDGGVTTMNFAQAALLVQSSSCVYSKKVEYLYSLVYQYLDLVTNKKNPAQKSSVNDDGNDEDASLHDDNDDKFLSLDDIPDGKNVNLKEDFEDWEKFQLLPQIPLCLIPLEDDEKGNNPLLSKKGEVLASLNDFKINTSHIHTTGTLLLDLSYLKHLEDALGNIGMQPPGRTQGPMDTDIEPRNVHEISTENDAPHDDIPPDDCVADTSYNPPETVNLPDEQMEIDRAALHEADGQRKAVIEDRVPVKKKPVIDLLQPVDVTEELKTEKPLVKGRNIIRLCPGIEAPTRKRKRKNAKANPMVESLNEFMYRTCFTNVHRFPKSANKLMILRGCEDRYWKEYKRRLSLAREQLKKERESNRAEEELEEDLEEEERRLNEQDDGENNLENNYEDDNLVDDDLFNAIDIATGSDDNPLQDLYNSISDNLGDCEVVNYYEDIVRKHVENYLASAQDYAQITDLSKRVSEWEEKILPRLEEEDRHAPFDINIYGGNVISNLYQDRNIKFRKIAEGKPQFEICRIFLATLMLANTGNVQIEEKGSLEKGMDLFELKLLSTKRHFEELQEYQAPSLESSSKTR